MKFNAAGLFGVGVQLALLHLLAHIAALNYLLSTAIAVEATLVHNFLWHERYTWRIRAKLDPHATVRRFVRFNLTNGIVSLVGNLLLMRLLVGYAGVPLTSANLIAIAACSTINFALAEFFVFAARSKPHDGGLFI
jgi:dolichol-phosphate mannosyltransferase